MTVKELIEKLGKYDPELKIYVPSKQTENDFCFAHSAKPKFLTIEESKEYPDETCVFIIDEV